MSRIRQYQLLDQWGLDHMQLHASVCASGLMESRSVVVIVTLRGRNSVVCESALTDGSILVLPAGAEINACIQEGAHYAGFVIPASVWSDIQMQSVGYPLFESVERPQTLGLGAEQSEWLQVYIGNFVALLDGMFARGDREGATNALTTALSGLVDRGSLVKGDYVAVNRSHQSRFRHARTARDFIHSHLGDTFLIEAVCGEIGVSRRQLEYSFRETFGVSPRDFVERARLNEIRRALLDTRNHGRTVTEIAFENGMQHLGRFSHSYRVLFGELPSETVRIRRVA